jgi:two-component system, LytTR family, sensor kinase
MDKTRNHIIFWVGYFLYHYVFFGLVYDSIKIFIVVAINTTKICVGTVCLYYFFVSYLFPRTLPPKKYLTLLSSIILLWLLVLLINYYVGFLIHTLFPKHIPLSSISKNTIWGLISIQHSFAFALFFWFLSIFMNNVKYEVLIKEKQSILRSSLQSAELLSLKNQINPHFLYNMLNFFYAQFLPFSQIISHSILKLSNMMRYTIKDNHEGKVSLEEEIKYLKTYVELENIDRISNKMIMQITGNSKFKRIKPLLFQLILEHSYLFGTKVFFRLDITDSLVVFSSDYIKKECIETSAVVKNIEEIKQKLSNVKEAKFRCQYNESRWNIQLLLAS